MKVKIGIGAIVILMLTYVFAAPYITAYQMRRAVVNHNSDALSRYVDFPAVRQNLKDQLSAAFIRQMDKEAANDNPFAGLGAAFGGMMVDKLVDAYVTPAAIAEFMKGEKPDSVASANNSAAGGASAKPAVPFSMSYSSFSTFTITTNESKPEERVSFILKRRGLGWKLVEIRLPL